MPARHSPQPSQADPAASPVPPPLSLGGYRLECELLVAADLATAFAVFENPYNLARITPPWLGFEILTRKLEMRQGAEIDYRLRWMGVRLGWKTVISHYQPPFCFVDEMLGGPYRFWWHRHTFQPAPGGTLVRDEVHYGLPFGLLGRWAHRLAVARQLTGIFSYRQKVLASLLGVAAEPAPPSIRAR